MLLAGKVAHKKESDSLVTGNGDRLNDHVLGGTVLSSRFHCGYRIDDIAGFLICHLTEDGVLEVSHVVGATVMKN